MIGRGLVLFRKIHIFAALKSEILRTERRKYLLSVGLLVLYLVFQAGITVFPHVHIVNGEKVVHSHPYSSANHNHSGDSIATIARLSSVQTLKAESAFCQELMLPMLYAVELAGGVDVIYAGHTHSAGLRGPPVC